MTKTREDLIARALHKLGAVSAGQAPAAEDAQLLDDEIEPVMADLMARGVYAWGDPEVIEDDAFVHLADILANSVARDFGKPQDDAMRLAAERRLRQLEAVVLSGQPQVTEYF